MHFIRIERKHIKLWVVKNSIVNNPNRKYWSAAITIGYDYYGKGKTIEQAYNDLTDQIIKSPFIVNQLKDNISFREILDVN